MLGSHDQLGFPTDSMPWLVVLVRLSLAAVLGALIGLERHFSKKPAGARTVTLVSSVCCAFVLLGLELTRNIEPGSGLQGDPSRVLSYLIAGVGFLGAGTIMHSKESVHGLTTASAIWAAAALGAACGLGEYIIAGMLFGVLVCVLWAPMLLHSLRRRFTRRKENKHSPITDG